MDEILNDFDRKLVEMKNIYQATEQQFIEFNDIIPYGHNKNWNAIYSPRLVTLLLSIAPQVETMTKILIDHMNLKPENKGENFYDYFNVLDEQEMLKIQEVALPVPGYPNRLIYPFEKNSDGNLDWWWAYNQIKHHSPKGMYTVTLEHAINALAALSVLHHVCYITKTWKMAKGEFGEILDGKTWETDEAAGVEAGAPESNWRPNELSVLWSSKIFFFCTRRFPMV